MAAGIGWVDWAMLAVLALSLLVGATRGLVFEILAIAGWFVAYLVALWAAPLLAPHLPVGESGSLLNRSVAFGSLFIAVLIAWGLLSRLTRNLLRSTPLAPIDRLLGAVFGLLRGVVVLVAVAALVAHTPAVRSDAWQASMGAVWLNSLLSVVISVLPSAWSGARET